MGHRIIFITLSHFVLKISIIKLITNWRENYPRAPAGGGVISGTVSTKAIGINLCGLCYTLMKWCHTRAMGY
jgi:hypothetical protein